MTELSKNYFIRGSSVRKFICDYKYDSWNSSIGARILRVLVKHSLTFTPRNLAPNVITIVNFAIHLLCFFLIKFTHKNFLSEENYPVLFVLQGLNFILYQYLDCLDGEQARRLKSENSLGEFLDHSIDQSAVYTSIIIGLCILRGGETFFSLLTIFLLSSICYFVTWNAMITGVLQQSQLSSGVEFHVIYAAGGCFIISLFGNDIFETQILSIPLKYFISGVFVVSYITTFVSKILNVLKNKSQVRKSLENRDVIWSIIPYFFLVVWYWGIFFLKPEFCKKNVTQFGSFFMLSCIYFQILYVGAKLCHSVPRRRYLYFVVVAFPVLMGGFGSDVGLRLFVGLVGCCLILVFVVICRELMEIIDVGLFEIADKNRIRKLYYNSCNTVSTRIKVKNMQNM